tara:strand:- start:3844 stop:6777 length:2934 start_codon:yes stop_codon:yes gene_type:complete
MAGSLQDFYLDAGNLSLAMCVFTNSTLTTVAPQGYYSDGFVTRYLTVTGSNGVLGNPLETPDCYAGCGDTGEIINTKNTSFQGGLPGQFKGTYQMWLDTGVGPDSTGAIICRVIFSYTSTPATTPINGYSPPMGLYAFAEINGDLVLGVNNFTCAGSYDSAMIAGIPNTQAMALVNPSLGGDNGGAVKKTLSNAMPVTNSADAVWVGSACQTWSDPAAACALAYPQIPNNAQYVNGTAGTVTAAGLPSYRLSSYNNIQWVPNSPATRDIQVVAGAPYQTQIGPVDPACAGPPGDGARFRGWYTCVIPKASFNIDRAVLQVENLGCDGGVEMYIECAKSLEENAISCSQAYSDQISAMGGDPSVNTIYNVPGAVGVQTSGTPAATFWGGVPNRWDLVFNDVNGEFKADEGWYSYLAAGNLRLFYVNNYGVIEQTNIQGQLNVGGLNTPFGVKKLWSGGKGIYNADFTINTGSSGAVIVRMFWGGVQGGLPKGVMVVHSDPATGRTIGKYNLFSIRGSSNIDGDLTQANYSLHSSSDNVESLTGYLEGGPSAELAAYGSQNPAYTLGKDIDNTAASEWVSLTGARIGTFVNGEFVPPFDPAWEYFNGTPYNGVTLEQSDEYSLIETPVYIGRSAKQQSSTLIPCTQGNWTPGLPQDAIYSTIDCGNTDGDGSSGGVQNTYCQLNLPSNGNYQWSSNASTQAFAPGVDEDLYFGDAAYVIYGDTTYGGSTTGYADYIFEVSGDIGAVAPVVYPDFTTGCLECTYPQINYDGETQSWATGAQNSSIFVFNHQVQLYKSNSDPENIKSPGWGMAVIPLTGVLASDETITVRVYALGNQCAFKAQVGEVGALTAMADVYKPQSIGATTYTIASMCSGGALPTAETCFVAHNAFGGLIDGDFTGSEGPCVPGVAGGAGTPCATAGAMTTTRPYLNDMVFKDNTGLTRMDAGVYFVIIGGVNFTFKVDNWGVVRCLQPCADGFCS